MSIALETRGLTKIYEGGGIEVRAVDDASIQIQAGEFVALVGPSGSGKTTMLALLAGLLRPNEGQIFIEGRELSQMSDAALTRFRGEKIGFIFQDSNLLPYLTAQENVELMLRLSGQLTKTKKAEAKRLLNRLGLDERLKNLPAQLSGGQQQRVAIARALIHNPSVVLADEPTASLDSERAFQVVETFAQLIHEQNRAGIMVTHDLRMCKDVDKIIRMLDGRISQIIDNKEEILDLANANPLEATPA